MLQVDIRVFCKHATPPRLFYLFFLLDAESATSSVSAITMHAGSTPGTMGNIKSLINVRHATAGLPYAQVFCWHLGNSQKRESSCHIRFTMCIVWKVSGVCDCLGFQQSQEPHLVPSPNSTTDVPKWPWVHFKVNKRGFLAPGCHQIFSVVWFACWCREVSQATVSAFNNSITMQCTWEKEFIAHNGRERDNDAQMLHSFDQATKRCSLVSPKK